VIEPIEKVGSKRASQALAIETIGHVEDGVLLEGQNGAADQRIVRFRNPAVERVLGQG